jgi:hypothetical protein
MNLISEVNLSLKLTVFPYRRFVTFDLSFTVKTLSDIFIDKHITTLIYFAYD